MKLQLAAALLVPALVFAVPTTGLTHEAPAFVVKGEVAFGNPTSLGMTENLAACNPSSVFNGKDGWWVDVQGYGGHAASLEIISIFLDADVWFFDTGCRRIGDDSMAKNSIGLGESGKVPAAAAFALVDAFLGSGEFVLEVASVHGD